MSTGKHHAWALIQPITQVKANTRGAFGIAAAFTAEDGTDYVLVARDKATVRRMAQHKDQRQPLLPRGHGAVVDGGPRRQ